MTDLMQWKGLVGSHCRILGVIYIIALCDVRSTKARFLSKRNRLRLARFPSKRNASDCGWMETGLNIPSCRSPALITYTADKT